MQPMSLAAGALGVLLGLGAEPVTGEAFAAEGTSPAAEASSPAAEGMSSEAERTSPEAEGASPEAEGTSPAAVPELTSPAAEAVSLRWEAPPGCPEVSAVRRALAGYLGQEPAREVGAGVQAVARVTAGEDGYRLSLRTETASGVTTRETTAEDCVVLVDATALIVAIAVDPTTVLGRGDEPAEPKPPPTPRTEPPPGLTPEPTPEPEVPEVRPFGGGEPPPVDPRRVRFGLRVGGGIDGGVFPGPAGGLRLVGAVLGARWRAELSGDYWFPRTAIAEAGIGGRISGGLGGVRGCGVPGIDRVGLEFPVCGGLEAGLLRGDPVGDRVDAPETSRQPWLAADASAALVWVPRRFLALFVQAELVVPIIRAGFAVGDVEVHRAGSIAGRGLLGLEARFP